MLVCLAERILVCLSVERERERERAWRCHSISSFTRMHESAYVGNKAF